MTSFSDERCPDCGGDLKFVDKNTFSGRDIREYCCVKCGKEVVEDRGVALWQVLHDTREADAATAKPRSRPWWRFW